MAGPWLGGGISTGVVGNAAYDAIKAAIERLRRREAHPTLPHDRDLVFFARTAVELQCATLHVNPLAATGLDVRCSKMLDGWLVSFQKDNSGVSVATVHLSVDEESADVKAAVRVPKRLLATRRRRRGPGPRRLRVAAAPPDDDEALRVLRAANELDPLPPE